MDNTTNLIESKPKNRLSLEDEDEVLINEFHRIIGNKEVQTAEAIRMNAICNEDPYLNMELGLHRYKDGLHLARVKRRAVNDEGTPIGVANDNPILDSRQYEVEYIDGRIKTLTANVIAENLLPQVDENGHQHMLLLEIEDHRSSSEAIPKEKGTYKTKYELNRKIRTTKGWELYVR